MQAAPAPKEPEGPKEAPRRGEEQIVYIKLNELHAFKNHPFEVRDDEEMRAMVSSVKDKGVTQPAKELLPPQLLYRKKSPYPKTYSPVYESLLVERFRQMLSNSQAPVHRFLDRKKAMQFLEQPKDYGRPWFGQLMAGPQMIAYFLQVNYWMEQYGIG